MSPFLPPGRSRCGEKLESVVRNGSLRDDVRVSEVCVKTAKPDGTGTGGIGLRRTSLYDAEVPPLGFILTKLSTSESNRRHTRRSDRAGSAGGLCRGLCRHTHGRGRMQALLRPRGLCRGPTRELAPVTDPALNRQTDPLTSPESERASIQRGMIMDATGPVGGKERTACALSPACCRSDACEMSACLLIGERNGRRRRSRIASRCCCCQCQRGQCSSR